MISDGHTTDFFHNPWISDFTLSKWPTFVSTEIGRNVKISELFIVGVADGALTRYPSILSLILRIECSLLRSLLMGSEM